MWNLPIVFEEDLTFEEIIDEMICEVWHTVKGSVENFLEHAINILNVTTTGLSQNPSSEELKQAIKKCEKELKKDKHHGTIT